MNDQNSNEPKFWKGDSVKGFVYGAFAGLITGIFNISLWNIPHLGLIIFVAIWLLIGTNPTFKDKRSPEEIKRDHEQHLKNMKEEKIAKANAKAIKKQAATEKLDMQLKKNELKLQKQQLKNSTKIKCPKCKSTNVQPLGVHKKGFSVGKAVGGAVLIGGLGTMAGFAGKRTKKTDFVCLKCGKQFKK
ncbi:hypothetical protein [Ligilactobacillus animalis]|uniref:hypothetical protein n=1 Tax=Ligilactobacillus animalis TaxID=1605 RepID=UPI00291B3DD2|nr:hypothetical protein [Ligilactobacillus animalis]